MKYVTHEYRSLDLEWKDGFHKQWKRKLKAVARALGLAPAQYTVRSNKGGTAVLGEVTLHADNIYVQAGGSMPNNAEQLLYRSCTSQKDYTGGHNNWMDASLDVTEIAQRLRAIGGCSE